MAYIVVYQRADGSSGVEECNDLDLAIVAAERLRNVDSVEHPRIFETKEISYDFRPYYRIEVTAADSAAAPAAEATGVHAAEVRPPAPPFVEAAAPAVEDAPAVEETDAAAERVVESIAADPWSAEQAPEPEAETPAAPAPPIVPGRAAGLFNDVRDGLSDGDADDDDDEDDISPRRGLFGR